MLQLLHNLQQLNQYAAVYAEQANTIREMAERSDCVIVGRCADYILRDMKPIRIFIYADTASRMERCRRKGEEEEQLSDRSLRRKILSIDRNRGHYYRHYTGQTWGERSNYDICINTSGLDIKASAHALAQMLREA